MGTLVGLGLVLLAATATPVTLSGDLPVLGPPVWVVGGQRLAFAAKVEGASRWYLVPVAGGAPVVQEPVPLYESVERVWWGPAGDRYAYTATEHGRHTMYVQALGAAEPQAFAVVGRVEPVGLGWAPVGGRVAFPVEIAPSAKGHYDLFACEADGAAGTRITSFTAPAGILWNSTGRTYAYCSYDIGRAMLMVCHHEQHQAFSLAEQLVPFAGSLSWSPDGKWLWFSATLDMSRDKRPDRPKPAPRLFRVRAEPRMPVTPIERPGYVGETRAVFSHDGQRVAWIAGPLSAPTRGQLYVGRADNPDAAERVLGGVGAVLSFIPLIILLFLFISLLEDSGYMSRAAFVMDKFLHIFGLHGQSFLPMMLGFGCSVPAIMASRTLKSPARGRASSRILV